MPGQSDMTVTLKWIVNSLLYDNGHAVIMDILKYKFHQFFALHHVTASDHVLHATQPQTYGNAYASQPTAGSSKTSYDDEDEQMSARDYLAPNPVVEAPKFEQLWASSPEMYVLVAAALIE